MIGLRRHLANRLQCSRRVEYNPAILFVAGSSDAFHGLARFDSLDDFEERFLALTFDDNVDIVGRQRLMRQQGWMPSTQHDGFVRIKLLGLASNLHRFLDHWSGDQRYRQAERIPEFFQYPLLEIG